MKKSIVLSSLLCLFLLVSSQGYAQSKNYSTVYIDKKVDGKWSGTSKTSFSATLSKPEKGESSPLMLLLNRPDQDAFFMIVKYEAETSDGKAFHKIMGGVYGTPKWVSHTGSTEMDWIYFNKNAYDIWAADPKPFDVEIEFADGSAVKYYISP